MTETEPVEVVRAFLDNIGDFDRAAPYLADDLVYENVGTIPMPTLRSRRSAVRFLRLAFRLCSEFRIETHHIAADGPYVLTERTDMLLFGRARADFWVCGRFEVRDGRIVHWRDYFDNGNVMLGFVRAGARSLWRS